MPPPVEPLQPDIWSFGWVGAIVLIVVVTLVSIRMLFPKLSNILRWPAPNGNGNGCDKKLTKTLESLAANSGEMLKAQRETNDLLAKMAERLLLGNEEHKAIAKSLDRVEGLQLAALGRERSQG